MKANCSLFDFLKFVHGRKRYEHFCDFTIRTLMVTVVEHRSVNRLAYVSRFDRMSYTHYMNAVLYQNTFRHVFAQTDQQREILPRAMVNSERIDNLYNK